MNTIIQDNNFFEKINQDFNDHSYYGLQYILDDLVEEYAIHTEDSTTTDWYGLADLTIE